MFPFEALQEMQSAGVGVVGLNLGSSSIAVRWRWRNGGDTFPVRFPANRKIRWVPRGKVKRHPVTSATVARVRIDDERAVPDSHVGR